MAFLRSGQQYVAFLRSGTVQYVKSLMHNHKSGQGIYIRLQGHNIFYQRAVERKLAVVTEV